MSCSNRNPPHSLVATCNDRVPGAPFTVYNIWRATLLAETRVYFRAWTPHFEHNPAHFTLTAKLYFDTFFFNLLFNNNNNNPKTWNGGPPRTPRHLSPNLTPFIVLSLYQTRHPPPRFILFSRRYLWRCFPPSHSFQFSQLSVSPWDNTGQKATNKDLPFFHLGSRISFHVAIDSRKWVSKY